MSWRQCHTCGWWQKQRGACIGCSRSSWPTWSHSSSSKPKAASPTPAIGEATLTQRWLAAKHSSMDPRHVEIEVMCTSCFTRSLTAKPTCRSCSHSMQNCYRIVPGQWPPIGATTTVVAQYEGSASSAPAVEAPLQTAPAQDISMAPSPPSAIPVDAALAQLSTTQLRQEIARVERHLQDLPSDVFSALRSSIEQSLQQEGRACGPASGGTAPRPSHCSAQTGFESSPACRSPPPTAWPLPVWNRRPQPRRLPRRMWSNCASRLRMPRLPLSCIQDCQLPRSLPCLVFSNRPACQRTNSHMWLALLAPPPPPPAQHAPPPVSATHLDSHGSQSAPPSGVMTQLLATPLSPALPPPAAGTARPGRSTPAATLRNPHAVPRARRIATPKFCADTHLLPPYRASHRARSPHVACCFFGALCCCTLCHLTGFPVAPLYIVLRPSADPASLAFACSLVARCVKKHSLRALPRSRVLFLPLMYAFSVLFLLCPLLFLNWALPPTTPPLAGGQRFLAPKPIDLHSLALQTLACTRPPVHASCSESACATHCHWASTSVLASHRHPASCAPQSFLGTCFCAQTRGYFQQLGCAALCGYYTQPCLAELVAASACFCAKTRGFSRQLGCAAFDCDYYTQLCGAELVAATACFWDKTCGFQPLLCAALACGYYKPYTAELVATACPRFVLRSSTQHGFPEPSQVRYATWTRQRWSLVRWQHPSMVPHHRRRSSHALRVNRGAARSASGLSSAVMCCGSWAPGMQIIGSAKVARQLSRLQIMMMTLQMTSHLEDADEIAVLQVLEMLAASVLALVQSQTLFPLARHLASNMASAKLHPQLGRLPSSRALSASSLPVPPRVTLHILRMSTLTATATRGRLQTMPRLLTSLLRMSGASSHSTMLTSTVPWPCSSGTWPMPFAPCQRNIAYSGQKLWLRLLHASGSLF